MYDQTLKNVGNLKVVRKHFLSWLILEKKKKSQNQSDWIEGFRNQGENMRKNNNIHCENTQNTLKLSNNTIDL